MDDHRKRRSNFHRGAAATTRAGAATGAPGQSYELTVQLTAPLHAPDHWVIRWDAAAAPDVLRLPTPEPTIDANGHTYTYTLTHTYPTRGGHTVSATPWSPWATLSPTATRVVNVALAGEVPTVATPAAVTARTPTTATLAALGADADGSEPALTYAWSVVAKPEGAVDPTFSAGGTNAAKAATATFTKAGSYTLRVTITDADGLMAQSDVTLSVARVLNAQTGHITVDPTSVAVHTTWEQQFTATAFDQFGRAYPSPPEFTWSIDDGGVGTIDPETGLYTAGPTPGTATVRATARGATATAAIVVSNTAPVPTTPVAAPAIVTGTTTHLTVSASDDGGDANLMYEWLCTQSPDGAADPTLATPAAATTTATFSAAGEYHFIARITDAQGLATDSAAVTVVVEHTLQPGTLDIDPDAAPLTPGGTVQFAATGLDQFADLFTPPGTWAVDAGGAGGTINAAGLYTAPDATTGGDTVRFTAANGQTATARTDAPVASIAGPATVAANTDYVLELAAVGSGDAVVDHWIIEWEGSGDLAPELVVGWPATITHRYADVGIRQIHATAYLQPPLGTRAYAIANPVPVTVNIAPPTVAISAPPRRRPRRHLHAGPVRRRARQLPRHQVDDQLGRRLARTGGGWQPKLRPPTRSPMPAPERSPPPRSTTTPTRTKPLHC